jgi:hypothetical protein
MSLPPSLVLFVDSRTIAVIAWNINLIMNREIINNIIIASRAYLLQSQELEKCRTQLTATTAELEKAKEASPGNVSLHRENIIIYQQY